MRVCEVRILSECSQNQANTGFEQGEVSRSAVSDPETDTRERNEPRELGDPSEHEVIGSGLFEVVLRCAGETGKG